MNSTEDIQQNGIHPDEPCSSGQVTSADNNANLSNETNHCKGAIPKIKSAKSKVEGVSKKSTKINNNLEEVNTHMKGDILRLNGLSNGSTGCFLDLCQSSSCSEKDYNTSNEFKQPSSLLQSDDLISTSRAGVYKETLKSDNSDSSTEDDLFSVSDDGCIYTYKGDQMADLPSSFFSLDIQLPEMPERAISSRLQTSSPEMDFLEMDFDPGPSEDANSECSELQTTENLPEDNKTEDTVNNLIQNQVEKVNNIEEKKVRDAPHLVFETSKVNKIVKNKEVHVSSCKKDASIKSEAEINKLMPWFCPFSERTVSDQNNCTTRKYHSTKGELMSPTDKMQIFMCSKSVEPISNNNIEPTMIWSEQEAYYKQFNQIGASACGATAVLNVLNALRFPIPSPEKLHDCIKTRLRANTSPLTEYLLSRSNAGVTHDDLIEGLTNLSDNHIYARFFHMYPERIVNLYSWLGFWIKNGAIPIATLNLQKCSAGNTPDAWHHQMIFGVGPKGIYLTNPLECVKDSQIWPQLCSESVLLIRREDVLSRWNCKTDLPQLMKIMDPRWRQINVVGELNCR